MKKDKKVEKGTNYMVLYMSWGIAIGTVIGIAVDNLGTYMPVGLAVGMCIGAFVDGNNRKKNDGN